MPRKIDGTLFFLDSYWFCLFFFLLFASFFLTVYPLHTLSYPLHLLFLPTQWISEWYISKSCLLSGWILSLKDFCNTAFVYFMTLFFCLVLKSVWISILFLLTSVSAALGQRVPFISFLELWTQSLLFTERVEKNTNPKPFFFLLTSLLGEGAYT